MNIDMRLIALALLVVGIVGLGTYWWMSPSSTPSNATPSSVKQSAELSPEVEAVLTKETAFLVELFHHPEIFNDVMTSNQKNGTLTQADIQRLDKEWQQSKELTPFIRQFLTNITAQHLIAFQTEHPGFREIFVTDQYGLNVGQTDKTSDYYQADEAWWQDSYAGGRGKTLHGKIEFDESSQTEAISIYVPIIHPETGQAVGVLKGVLDLAVIKSQL